jgi:tetratricopeptide (TPR) repeat protein
MDATVEAAKAPEISFEDALERYKAARDAWMEARDAWVDAYNAGKATPDGRVDEAREAYKKAFDKLIRTEPADKQDLAWLVRTVMDEFDRCADSEEDLQVAIRTIENALGELMPEAYSE